jgi:ABC-2 type transport system permease protein
MLRLFRIEWMKIKTYRAFWVLFGAFIIFFPITFYFISKEFLSNAGNQEDMLKSMFPNPFTFPVAWHSAGYFGGFFFIIIGMLFIMLITNEVQYRTHRQNIIDGWSRADFLLAKLSLLIFFVLVATLLVAICGYWIGSIYTEPNTVSWQSGIHYIGYFALMATVYLVVAFCIGILIKRTGLSIIIYFAFVCLVDNILFVVLNRNGGQAGYFLPLESSDSLFPLPFKPKSFEKRTVGDSSLMLTAIGYILVLGFVIRNYFLKSDLKT